MDYYTAMKKEWSTATHMNLSEYRNITLNENINCRTFVVIFLWSQIQENFKMQLRGIGLGRNIQGVSLVFLSDRYTGINLMFMHYRPTYISQGSLMWIIKVTEF